MGFVCKRELMDEEQIKKTLMRMTHEILERNKDISNLVIVGIRTRGVTLAERIIKNIYELEGTTVPLGILDITLYRDDLSSKELQLSVRDTEILFDITDKVVILVDDVLYTGRSIRAAIDELMDFGRPAYIQLAVLVDRGHRELPIRPDYVGRNIPTSKKEEIKVRLKEIDGIDQVIIGVEE